MEFFLTELNWLFFIVKIFLSTACGIAIGIERESMGKPAGIKTHSIICLGSCIFTHISFAVIAGDPTRIAAQIVSGIGFIGAGTILHSKQRIEGLTSAALVFVNASIGMLIGASFFFYAIIATLSLLFLFFILRHNTFKQKLFNFHIYVKVSSYSDIKKLFNTLESLNCTIINKKIEKNKQHIDLSITYVASKLENHAILSTLYRLKNVLSFKQN